METIFSRWLHGSWKHECPMVLKPTLKHYWSTTVCPLRYLPLAELHHHIKIIISILHQGWGITGRVWAPRAPHYLTITWCGSASPLLLLPPQVPQINYDVDLRSVRCDDTIHHACSLTVTSLIWCLASCDDTFSSQISTLTQLYSLDFSNNQLTVNLPSSVSCYM